VSVNSEIPAEQPAKFELIGPHDRIVTVKLQGNWVEYSDVTATVAAMSRAIEQLSQDIAATLRAFSSSSGNDTGAD
jgi:hypothetical protein